MSEPIRVSLPVIPSEYRVEHLTMDLIDSMGEDWVLVCGGYFSLTTRELTSTHNVPTPTGPVSLTSFDVATGCACWQNVSMERVQFPGVQITGAMPLRDEDVDGLQMGTILYSQTKRCLFVVGGGYQYGGGIHGSLRTWMLTYKCDAVSAAVESRAMYSESRDVRHMNFFILYGEPTPDFVLK